MFDLYIGNKNYSSWSLRVWLLLRHFRVPFREHKISIAGGGYNPMLKPLAGSARVPCVHTQEGFQVWESIAIAEYFAESIPSMWPSNVLARARARSVSAEVHAGFTNLRTVMPMNLKLRLNRGQPSPHVQSDIERIVEIWTEARSCFAAGGGAYLFGPFTIADAMFAPIVCRLTTYGIDLPESASAYCDTMLSHPAMIEWRNAALDETECLPQIDATAAEYGSPF